MRNPSTPQKVERLFKVAILVAVTATIRDATAEDWPLYRGPKGDGVAAERINLDWPAGGPKRLWRVSLTNGLSSITISEGRVFTQSRRSVNGQDLEFCLAYAADTGTMLWNQAVGNASYPHGGVGSDDGPRSTPVVKAGHVYVLSSYLDLVCLEAASGAVVWNKNLRAEFGSNPILWQNAASPLLVGDLVLLNLNAGSRRLAAFRADTGGLVWRALEERMTHATPVAATIHGIPHAIFLTQTGLVAVAPEDGRELWRHAFGYNTSTGASPVVEGNTVYCSAAYGVGATAVSIGQAGDVFTSEERWKKRGALMNHWSTAVAHEGHVYGLYGQSLHYSAPLKCVELATGAEKWSEDGFGLGATLLVNDKILALTEGGEIVIVEPDPAAYRELGRFQAVQGKAWNSPALSGGRLFVRSTTEMAAFDVSLPLPKPLRLGAVQVLDNDAVRFTLSGVDGQPVSLDRARRIQVLWAAAVPSAEWESRTAAFSAQGDSLLVEVPLAATSDRSYFRVVEQP